MLVAVSGAFWTTSVRQIGAALWFRNFGSGSDFFSFQLLAHGSTFQCFLPSHLFGGWILWATAVHFTPRISMLGETISLLSLSPASTRADSALHGANGRCTALCVKNFNPTRSA